MHPVLVASRGVDLTATFGRRTSVGRTTTRRGIVAKRGGKVNFTACYADGIYTRYIYGSVLVCLLQIYFLYITPFLFMGHIQWRESVFKKIYQSTARHVKIQMDIHSDRVLKRR